MIERIFTVTDVGLALLVAAVFMTLVSLVREPARQRAMAIFVAGASGVYFSGGLGMWELAFPPLMLGCAYLGLRNYRFIGVAWFLHTGWDVVHHLYGQPIVFFAPTSSGQCAVADAVIGIWFFLGAPSLFRAFEHRPHQISSDL